jgi:hypothetical protein
MWLCALAALLFLSGTPFCRGQNPPGTVYVEGQNLSFHVIDDVQLTAIRMNGFLVPRAGKIASLDDRRSFTLQIRNAETRISAKDVSSLLNRYILPHAQTAIHDVDVTFDGQTLLVKGSLKKGLSVPFEGKGVMSVTPEGDLRVHFTDFKAAGILKKGLLEALGLKLSSVATPKHQPSFQINDNDVIVSVMRLFPPPHVAGKLVSVRVEGDSLIQTFGRSEGPWKTPLVKAANYIYFRGGKDPVRENDHGRRGPAAYRSGPVDALRFLAGSLS